MLMILRRRCTFAFRITRKTKLWTVCDSISTQPINVNEVLASGNQNEEGQALEQMGIGSAGDASWNRTGRR
jgi:hypothetical protein